MIYKILFILLVGWTSCAHESQIEHQFIDFFQGCRKELSQWVGFQQNTQTLIQKCNLNALQETILNLYKQLTLIGLSFNQRHFDLIRKYLKEKLEFRNGMKCLVDSRNTQNQYFKEEKKFKYFGKFVKEHPKQGKLLFVQQDKMWFEKGKKICDYFKAFFQFYYLNVLRPSQTLSTTFLRALTVRTNIFNHEDIAYCVDLDSHGTLTQNLDGLDINNIYIKIPQIMNSIRFIKIRRQCRSEKYTLMIKKIQQRLKNVDMFKIMYHDYEPFVQIAAQKFGTTQLKLLGRKFADIIQNVQEYQKYKDKQL